MPGRLISRGSLLSAAAGWPRGAFAAPRRQAAAAGRLGFARIGLGVAGGGGGRPPPGTSGTEAVFGGRAFGSLGGIDAQGGGLAGDGGGGRVEFVRAQAVNARVEVMPLLPDGDADAREQADDQDADDPLEDRNIGPYKGGAAALALGRRLPPARATPGGGVAAPASVFTGDLNKVSPARFMISG